jgi:DNA polymerase I-like protein with 3'-5' exonuclease and polymerase domains
MLVVTEQDVEQLLEFINSEEILAYDVESTGLNTRKDTIMGFGVSSSTSGFYIPCNRYDTVLSTVLPAGPGPELIKLVFAALKRKKLLMFNASFDARITKAYFGEDLLPALYADVLLLKHTCDENFPLDLKGIAAHLWGHDVKKEKEELKEAIKANGGTSKQYFKADTGVLARYCIQDCLLTYRLYNHYSRELRAQGLEDFYYKDEVLPLYKLVTIPMEEAGVALDLPKLLLAQEDIKVAIAKLEDAVQAAIATHLDAVFKPWFLTKEYPLSTWKGNVTLLGRAFTDGYSAHMSEIEFQEQAWRRDAEEHMFNLQSKHHLKKLFFDTLKEKPLSTTPTGQPQVDEAFLAGMVVKHGWCSILIEYNKLQKIKSTYIDRLLEEQENGIFYASFQQHRTVSGRYSGDLQQLPRTLEPSQASEAVVHFNNLIREFIVPRSNNVLVSADYEQLEPTVFAHTSRDEALQRIFNDGTDFYSTVAIQTEHLASVSAIKTATDYLGKVNKIARQKAKSYALGIAYGMTGYKLKFELDCSEEEANKLVESYLNAFPKLRRWMNESRNTVKDTGAIKTETGRMRHMPEVKRLFKKYGPVIDNDLELWKCYYHMPSLYVQVKADRKIYKNLLNNAINFQVQGLAASIMNRACIALALKGHVPILQVHDQIVFDCSKQEATELGALIKHTMENTTKLSVPLRTDPIYGESFRKCK